MEYKERPDLTALLYGEPCKSINIAIYRADLSEIEISPIGLTEYEMPTALRIIADIIENNLKKKSLEESKKNGVQKINEVAKGITS